MCRYMGLIYNKHPLVTQYSYMQQAQPQKSQPRPQISNTNTYKSPYFSSVHRSRSKNSPKHRISASAQNALHISKYPLLQDDSKGEHNSQNRKVFKRFSKFEQVDEMYVYACQAEASLDRKKGISSTTRVNQQINELEGPVKSRQLISVNPKTILYSNKTLALMQKYTSYKSIMLSAPKPWKTRSRSKQQSSMVEISTGAGVRSFRTKIKSGTTIQWTHNQQSKDTMEKEKPDPRYVDEDWLAKELIWEEVYGSNDFQGF